MFYKYTGFFVHKSAFKHRWWKRFKTIQYPVFLFFKAQMLELQEKESRKHDILFYQLTFLQGSSSRFFNK
jgi:hypothetical protein